MYYNIDWDITLGNYSLQMLAGVEVISSVDTLADTCTIELPEAAFNKAFNIEQKLKRGDSVLVKFGYDDDLKTEFTGYILNIQSDDSSLKINCEDGLFTLRKPVTDKKFKAASVKDIAAYVIEQTGSGLKLVCDLDLRYESFVISKADGYDVLKKLQEETSGNIYVKDNNLHLHPKYSEKAGDVRYSFQHNIEKGDLKYVKAEDKKIEIKITSTDKNGKIREEKYGTTGGEVKEFKGEGLDAASMKARAKQEYSLAMMDGYEGDITAWLIPEAKPTMTAKIEDEDYEWKDGRYYIVSVTTKINESGGERKITIGKKLS